jgi:hypothetical protein
MGEMKTPSVEIISTERRFSLHLHSSAALSVLMMLVDWKMAALL